MKKINLRKTIFSILTFIILFNSFIFLIPSHVNGAYNQVIIEANKDNNNGIDSFPKSYQTMLKKLVSETGHENWKFKAFYTNIDWSELTSSSNENKCLRNTVYKDNGTMMCSCGREGDKGYYCASSKAVNYYLDPRNFLTETTIFQFLDLSNSTKVSIEDIQRAVEGTYLSGEVEGESYSKIIYDAAEESGESALSILVKIFQELGKGKNLPSMIAGNNETYPNTYNFFNYGATDGEGNTLRGLEYANKSGWNTPRKALIEGAKLIANSYICAGQNTKYTFKFDVVDDNATGLYWHQYMTNIQDPNNQAKMLYDEYLNNNWLNNELTFVIPVYKNMPAYVKLPSALTTENGELYYISSNYMGVSLRSKANTTSEIMATLKKDTIVLMLEYNVNNSDWSKVSVDGKEGYVSNKYLTKVNNEKDIYEVPEQPSGEDTNPPVGLPEVTPSTNIKGDADGDGQITASDYVLIKNQIMGISKLTEEQEMRADFDLDGQITASDYVLIKNEIMK